jgi:nucleoside-diphosphate-sugar epimerase
MRILLTGAAGFVGCHVAKLLVREGHEVEAVVRPGSEPWRLGGVNGARVVECPLEDAVAVRELVRRTQPESCFHLAWASGSNLDAFEHAESLQSGLSLALALAEAGCQQFVGTGTNYEYDTSLGYLAETTPLLPLTLHAATKLALHTGLKKLEQRFPMRSVWVRPFFVYGPFEDERRLVPGVIRSLRERTAVRTTSGEQIRDYLHVEDVASGICAAAREKLPVANIGSGIPVAVIDIIKELASILQGEQYLQIGALPQRPGEPPFICANSSLLRSRGWRPKFDLKSGLRNTVEWCLHGGQ